MFPFLIFISFFGAYFLSLLCQVLKTFTTLILILHLNYLAYSIEIEKDLDFACLILSFVLLCSLSFCRKKCIYGVLLGIKMSP